MPRGRHRHSPPLHRLLPPSAVAGASVACASGAWLLGDPVALRVLVAAAAAAAVTGAVLMRSWDRAAGKRVAELTRARRSDEWRAEERIAEVEGDLEESREMRAALEAKLRAKRTELSRLRNEHAELLRRYATAETERASALEGRRLLALEAAAPAKELTAASANGLLDANGAPTPGAYARADRALTELIRNGARQHAKRTVEAARRRDLAEREREREREQEQERAGEEQSQGKHAAATGEGTGSRSAANSADSAHSPNSADSVDTADAAAHSADAPAGSAGAGADGGTETDDAAGSDDDGHKVPVAAAVVPYAPLRRPTSRVEGGFDFFGAKSGGRKRPERPALASAQRPELAAAPSPSPVPAESGEDLGAGDVAAGDVAAENVAAGDVVAEDLAGEDLADVVGAEALAAAREEEADGGEVIDLTEHDETEQIDVRELRAHSS
ncbi:hypothetical protein [Streptomyces sp. 7N604]|uniref:hypothetical protein n=1 Tax=Streptomyces sp. 7N604 TaxID=3457415 RepID=UPI003FD085D6